jgi:isopentenyl-diphosphate Delta-isomerase
VTDKGDLVVLLNNDGSVAGTGPKNAAHRAPGQLHLAFSVFLFDAAGKVLLQRRAPDKALFAGAWSNSCCSHPRPGEAIAGAARRRVAEELGIDCHLEEVGLFDYHAHDAVSGLDERERVHVLVGVVGQDGASPDPREVSEVRWVRYDDVLSELADAPDTFSPWLPPALEAVRPWWEVAVRDRPDVTSTGS